MFVVDEKKGGIRGFYTQREVTERRTLIIGTQRNHRMRDILSLKALLPYLGWALDAVQNLLDHCIRIKIS
jgi:hypothetical protein